MPQFYEPVGFAPVSPVNGRMLDAQDVVYTWERFSKIGAARSDYANAVNPAAPILSLTAPDSRTDRDSPPSVGDPAIDLAVPAAAYFQINLLDGKSAKIIVNRI